MRTPIRKVLLPVLCAVVLPALAETDTGRYEFSRYEVILTRKPFGEAVPPPGANAPMQAENDAFKDLTLVSIVESPTGEIVVGLVNKTNSCSYRIPLGQVVDDLEALDADFDEEKALIRKDGFERWMMLGGGAAGGLDAGYDGSAGSMDSAMVARRDAAVERARRRRETVRRREVEAPPQLTNEQLENHLKEYQMDLIRKGDPPLPIPLTQEMDDQLVKEGVLPPSQ